MLNVQVEVKTFFHGNGGEDGGEGEGRGGGSFHGIEFICISVNKN